MHIFYRSLVFLISVFSVFPLNAQGPQNLGKTVNSTMHEVLPVISADGRTLYFCRQDGYSDMGEIYYSRLNSDGTWSPAENIGSPLNNSEPNFVSSASPDGRTLLLGNPNSYSANKRNSYAAALTFRTDEGWSAPKPIHVKNFYNFSPYVSNFLASDGTTLLMALNREDSYGESDIYVSFREDDSTWSVPRNLGQQINSYADETTPFLAADGLSLYFSSNGHRGYGNNDIFVSRRLDSTWQNWSTPQNLGPAVNSNGWDAYYTIPASGDYAYMVSTKNSLGNPDLFRIKLSDSLRPAPVVLITGRVLDAKSNNPLRAKILYETLPDGKNAGVAYTQTSDGHYSIVLPAGKKYGFRAEAEGFIPISDNIDLRDVKDYREISRNLKLVPVSEGETVRINNLFFESGKAKLEPESFPELERIIVLLKSIPTMNVEVSGHTDNVGTAESNRKLSKERAQAVADYLISGGIAKNRMTVRGYGQTKPVMPNQSEEGRSQNRRVEFTIVKK